MADSTTTSPLGISEDLTPLEQDVLDEYARLSENMKKLASLLDTMATKPSGEILDGLRMLERKTSLVYTLLKASVYSIVMEQEIYSREGMGSVGAGGGEGDTLGGGRDGRGEAEGESLLD